jgi:hypothetical protein
MGCLLVKKFLVLEPPVKLDEGILELLEFTELIFVVFVGGFRLRVFDYLLGL